MEYIIGFVVGQLLSGPMWTFFHEIRLAKAKAAADVKAQKIHRNF